MAWRGGSEEDTDPARNPTSVSEPVHIEKLEN
jgi:hypothetical protein